VSSGTCEHASRVEVLNDYWEKLGVRKLEAQLCPDCGAQLDADWKPPPPPAAPAPVRAAAPGAGWKWRWWCTCGKTRNGWAATESTAQDAINRGVVPHQGIGHRWQSEWRYRG